MTPPVSIRVNKYHSDLYSSVIHHCGIEQLRGREVETSLIYSDNINTDVNIKQTYEQTQ